MPRLLLAHSQAWLWAAYEDGSLIRLHILAEDDSPQAQHTKLLVRDAVLEAFAPLLSEGDPQTLYQRLGENAEAFRQVAEDIARGLGFSGYVTAQVGVLTLPPKAYGQVVLPQGEYRALRITLGSGQGQNWWCVLFPSLCLAVADDEPWKTPAVASPEGEPQPEGASAPICWDSEKILSQWLCLPQGL